MAGLPAARRRPFNTRGRTSTTPKRRNGAEVITRSEPPQKKRRYVPGGPGGGGRYVDADGVETPVGGTGPGGYNYSGARGRIGPQNAANGITSTYEHPERPRRESRREKPPTRPRYSSAAAAAAAVVQGDGFKPREERGWEEFHQDLDIEANFPVFSADEVDGVIKQPLTPLNTLPHSNNGQTNGDACGLDVKTEAMDVTPAETYVALEPAITPQTMKRRPGRPPRRPDAMLKGIGTPDTPKLVPLPGPNPREKLTLPKPSFRIVDPFASFEKANGSVDYVDRTMAHVGYQESDHFIRPDRGFIRLTEGGIEEELDLGPIGKADGEINAAIGANGVGRVEYDMDEQDKMWLEAYNLLRREEQVEPVKPAIFEITMTKIEKEWHALEKRIPKPNPKPPQTHRPRSSSAAAVNGEPAGQGEEQDSKCAICDDGDCENTNAIVFCDGCDLAVHQECYGVPFIPEGQWLCRKCHLIGRGTPTCIFCPNTDGAFKQTNSSKWSHLLCAIWIPEVSLGNMTFMEPVMDVEKVPRNRWKLKCSICQQQMGACIQCGNKNCFRAFHVTCGRRAKWFLSMKSTHGGPASLDASVLKAFCDKHVPPDWRENNDVDGATAEAMSFYRYAMRGKVWVDSQQSASTIAAVHRFEAPVPTIEDSLPKGTLAISSSRRKKTGQTGKLVWRLPSGAPVVPSTVYDSVEASLQRFTVRKRKEFAQDVCRYWTLKREAKRGAALIKRLQLQMETFSSMEITRRNFAGMGTAGAVRLQRRIDFAESRTQEVKMLLELCGQLKERERAKLEDAEILRDIINTTYFPIPSLLWPIMDKALALDSKATFRSGLLKLREGLEKRLYASVAPFSSDLGSAFASVIGMSSTDPSQIESQIVGDRTTRKDLSTDDKDKRKLAKRIIRAVQAALDDANRKESELCRRPYEEELMDFDHLLEKSATSRRFSLDSFREEAQEGESSSAPTLSGDLPILGTSHSSTRPASIERTDANGTTIAEVITNGDINGNTDNDVEICHDQAPTNDLYKRSSPQQQLTPSSSSAAPSASALSINGVTTTNGHIESVSASQLSQTQQSSSSDHGPTTSHSHASPAKPPTPPISSSSEQHQTALSLGGVPWYMDPFDPVGTTVFEERWTGRDVARGMSEELSDMDEEELSGLVEGNLDIEAEIEEGGMGEKVVVSRGKDGAEESGGVGTRKKNGRLKKRWRGFK